MRKVCIPCVETSKTGESVKAKAKTYMSGDAKVYRLTKPVMRAIAIMREWEKGGRFMITAASFARLMWPNSSGCCQPWKPGQVSMLSAGIRRKSATFLQRLCALGFMRPETDMFNDWRFCLTEAGRTVEIPEIGRKG